MSPDFTHSMVSSFLPPATCEDTFSPLILALLENYSNNNIFVESFFSRLVFLFQDDDVFSKQLKRLIQNFSSEFNLFLSSVLSPLTSTPPTLSLLSTPSWSLAHSTLTQLLHFPSSNPTDLFNLVTNLPTDQQGGLIRSAVNRLGRLNNFNPFKPSSTGNIKMVVTVLKLAHSLHILTPDIQDQFSMAAEQYLTSVSQEVATTQPDLSLLSDSFTLLPTEKYPNIS